LSQTPQQLQSSRRVHHSTAFSSSGRIISEFCAREKKVPRCNKFPFSSIFSGWIDEKSLRPFAEFRDEMKQKGKPRDQFMQAMNDIESFIDNPDGFSALFEPKTPIQKKKASPKPKKSQDIELDFDSLKSDSSVPSSPSIAKTPVATAAAPKRSTSVRSTEKPKVAEKTPKIAEKTPKIAEKTPKVAEKTPKVPAVKRKATRESEPEEEAAPVEAPEPKKPRKTSQVPLASPQRQDSIPEVAKLTKIKSPRAAAPIEPSNTVFGFIGLGIIGQNVLNNMLESGHDVVIWNRTLSRCDEFVNRFGSQCSSVLTPKEVFEQAQITFVCVSDSDAVKETICDGERGVIAADSQSLDKGLVMLSSIDCETSRDISKALMMTGSVRYLEAQVQGSRKQAKEGSLLIIASGDQSLFNDCKSCFRAIAKDARYLGEENEAAVKMNLVLQTVAGVQLAAVSEALALADTFELQLRDILEIIGISNLKSEFIMEKGHVIVKEQFDDTSCKVDTMQKDLKMAIEFGDSLQQPLPIATASNEIFKAAKRLGFGQNDVASIYFASNLKNCVEPNGI
jgi:3-hydroxyisobutyrate dehydrogenase